MATTIQARTSRIDRLCDSCHFVASLRGKPTIAAGHRYLRHVAFPGDEVNRSHRPFSNTECVACASERDEYAPMLLAGACATFCHGVTPCARPFGHDGDHSCKECVDQSVAPVPVGATAR